MTIEELAAILALPPADAVGKLSVTSYPNLPKWSDLVKQYDPMKHEIITNTTRYPPKLDDNNQDDFKRTPLALQKLSVDRISQSMFVTPVKRNYNFDKDNTKEQEAINLIEEVYRTQNNIDAANIDRCKQLNASVQIATVWKVFEKDYIVNNEKAKFKLTHTTYSEMDGYKIYPILDNNGELLVLSIGYKDSNDKDTLAVYTNGDPAAYILYVKDGDWSIDQDVSKPLVVFPVLYMNIKTPVWGGDAGTILVEQLEEMESYQGLYIKRNSQPTFTMDYGDLPANSKKSATTETSADARRIIQVGKGGVMTDVTWKGARESISDRYSRIRNSYFEQIQVPDTSFANMVASNTSAENKELIFSDARAKAKDLGGNWEMFLYDEMEVVLKFLAVIFPKHSAFYETLSVRSIIQPYSTRTKKDNAEYVALAGSSMSLETQVKTLDEVEDIAQEVEAIEDERGASVNQLA